jgi:hypothetical protein
MELFPMKFRNGIIPAFIVAVLNALPAAAQAPLAVSLGGTSSGTGLLISTQAGTSYVMVAGDCGTAVNFTSASAVTVTLPSTLGVGCKIGIVQGGAGAVTAQAGSGASLLNPFATATTQAQNASMSAVVLTNAGSAAAWKIDNVPTTGGGSGGVATITDGTNPVTSATSLTFDSGVVSGSAGAAHYAGVTTTTYTSGATGTIPANAKLVRFIAQGQGGCGGGGGGMTTPFTGAGGAAGGGATPKDTGWFPASLVSGTYTVIVGTPCTGGTAGVAGGNGGNGSVGADVHISMTGLDTLWSYGGGGGAGAVGGAGNTATGGGGGSGQYADGASTTGATGGAGGSLNGGAGGAGGTAAIVTLAAGSSGGSGSTATGQAFNGRLAPAGSTGGASGGGCNVGVPAAGGASISPGNGLSVVGGAAGGATGGNGGVGLPSAGAGGGIGAGGGSGAGGGTTTGGTGGNGGLAGGGGGGGGSGCAASATGGAGGVGGAPQIIVQVM